ncbi:hypothetical protein [Vibrio vulnificus]|uniref:hypothetical protein n=1 Tax=Vibrio vulnificus TaxID=672 RepID=UPI001F4D86AB|nr:hypothetical protein [Vibrio vulnificus]
MAMVAECWQTIARHFLTSLLVIYSHRQQHWLRVIDDGENYVKRGGDSLFIKCNV